MGVSTPQSARGPGRKRGERRRADAESSQDVRARDDYERQCESLLVFLPLADTNISIAYVFRVTHRAKPPHCLSYRSAQHTRRWTRAGGEPTEHLRRNGVPPARWLYEGVGSVKRLSSSSLRGKRCNRCGCRTSLHSKYRQHVDSNPAGKNM